MDFTNVEGKCFDLLTVTVLLEQCDPDYTMVRYRMVASEKWYSSRRIPTMRAPPVLSDEMCRCLACLMRFYTRLRSVEEDKGALIEAVKEGRLVIIGAQLRTELSRCPTCQWKEAPVVNPHWEKSL